MSGCRRPNRVPAETNLYVISPSSCADTMPSGPYEFSEALHPRKNEGERETELDLAISAGANRAAITGYNRWRKRIEIDIDAPAKRQKANAALIAFLAEVLDVHSTDLELISGATNPHKRVRVHGLDTATVCQRLAKQFESG